MKHPRAKKVNPGPFRPVAVPLVTHDPYFSVWSAGDRLTDKWPTHWTGTTMGACGLVRIDGRELRFLGAGPMRTPTMKQLSLQVTPTRSIYEFAGAGVHMTLTFLSPLLPQDLDLLSRPVTYVTWSVRSMDGQRHEVNLYFDVTSQWVVDHAGQATTTSRVEGPRLGGLSVLRMGTRKQDVLGKVGDDLRIDWGYLYLATAKRGASLRSGGADTLRRLAAFRGEIREVDKANCPGMCCMLDLGRVGAKPVQRMAMLAYDDLWSIQYMGRNLRPWWRRKGMDGPGLLAAAYRDYPAIVRRCQAFDAELMDDLQKAGGVRYARLAALAFRQCMAAHKLAAGPNGAPLWMSKENFSNGCIDTVDVTYPSAPFFLLFNPELLKAQTTPILDYAASKRWNFPFAPHDLGTYPKANGQVYGGGEKTLLNQMPVEECGNMLLLVTALAQVDGNADYALRYWRQLSQWAAYLRDKGLDPANQLCTDDFAGHLAHNANLSLKAILALAGFARLCRLAGKPEEGREYRKLAQEMAARWEHLATERGHYRLAFDRPGTWSQKYNLVWDKLLKLNLFPAQVAQKETAFYLKKVNPFGLPLDSRRTYAKLDWSVWTATLAEGRDDFAALVDPLYDFADQSSDRVPLADFYQTTDGSLMRFQARSVVGGVFIKLLDDSRLWSKWRRRGKTWK